MDGRTIRGIIAASLLFMALGATAASAQSASVPRYDVFETTLTSSKSYGNPYTGVTVSAAFRAPSGRVVTATAFHDGGSTWRARVAPDEIGTWTWTTSASDPSDSGLHNRSGSFSCTASSSKGFIKPDASKKYWFSTSDGSPFYGMGDTCYGMVTSLSNTERTNYLNTRSSQKFNFVRFFASGYPFEKHSSLSSADTWAWGGSASSPDYDRFNPQYFRRLESILGELQSRGLYAEVEVFTYYAPPFTDPSTWTASRQNAWVKYLLSRLSAYTTVFLWTVTNEYELYPDGKYRYDGSSDDTWVRSMGTLFHASDPHKHPTTVHNFTFDANGGLGGRFGSGAEMDVLSQQSWGNSAWNGQYEDGDASGVEQTIWTDRVFNKPVINTENGYEWNSSYPQVQNSGGSMGTNKCRKAAWRVFAAGGATYAAGFQGTWRGTSEGTWQGLPSPFIVGDMGLAGQLGTYYTFITTKTNFRTLSPAQNLVNAPNLCLANAGSEYVVYLPSGGTAVLNLASGAYAVEWLNPRSGAYQGQTTVSGGASRSFAAPDGNDWVLHLGVGSGTPPGQPDVVVTSLSYSGGLFTCTVKNQGGTATPAGVMVGIGYFVDDVWASWGATAGPLAAGASESVGTQGSAFTIANGTHTIRATVDDVNRFAESNESNNQLSQTITVGSSSACDVVVTALSYANGVFTCTVKNQGGTATPAGVSIGVGYSVDGAWRSYGFGPNPLAAGASMTVGTDGGSYTIPSGTHTITAVVDDVNRFAESNENNNQLSQTVTVGGAPPPSLVARWKLDEGGGITAGDVSGNGNHGTLLNGPAWATGTLAGALSFDGSDDRVQVPDSNSLDLTAQGTISVWLFPRAFPDGYATVLEKFAGGGQGAGYQLLLGSSNTAALWLMSGGASSNMESPANLYSFNTWTHIAVTWNGTTLQFYKNGLPFGGAQTQPRAAGANTLPVVLGVDSGYTGRLNGMLDDVQLYNRALSASEIQALTGGGAAAKSAQAAVTLNGQGDYASLQEALDAAAPGEVVVLGPVALLVPGGLTIPAGVSLRGAGPDLTILDGDGAAAVLRVQGQASDGDVTIAHMTVRDAATGVDPGTAAVWVSDVRDETSPASSSGTPDGGSGGGSCGLLGLEALLVLAAAAWRNRCGRRI